MVGLGQHIETRMANKYPSIGERLRRMTAVVAAAAAAVAAEELNLSSTKCEMQQMPYRRDNVNKWQMQFS